MSETAAAVGDDRPEEGYGLSHEMLQAVEEALDAYNLQDVEKLVVPLHSAVMADLLEQLHPEDRRTVVGIIRPHLIADAEVLTYLDEEVRGQVIELLAPEEIASALAELDSDDALGVIEGLEEEEREKVLEALPTAARMFVEEGLTFPEYSAGRLMQREIVAVPMFWTVGKTIDWLRETEGLPDDFHLIFAVDPMYRPVGSVRLAHMLRSKRPVKVGAIISEDIRPIPAEMDQEEVAHQFRQLSLVSAPVVDKSGRLMGVITVDDIVDVIDEEAEDDLLKMGGVREDDLYRAVVDTTKSRFAWLGVNLVTAIVASMVIGVFEGTIQQIVALAVLMPIVASMGGNAGTQSLTVAVRGIAMRELTSDNAPRVLWKEVLVGSLNGLIFAVIAAPVAGLWFGDWMLGLVIGSAMIITLIAAGFSGALIPLVLERLKVDPAVASGVFLTTVTDVIGFFAFLGLAAWILI
ncbi:MAG: magnesium transporter [Rhodospirillaceae bacterium]|nr:magnesium transporter [Rhodospirillaceae bacterium]